MKALSVRQPWAWAIFYAGKDIENRDWRTWLRGTVAIHASGTMTRDEYQYGAGVIQRMFLRSALRPMSAAPGGPGATMVVRQELVLPSREELILGAIVGLVDVVDCVEESDSPWFQGDFGFVLTNPRPLKEPIPCNGARKFWEVPAEIAAQIEEQLR